MKKLRLIQAGLGAHGRGIGSHYVIPSPLFEYAGLIDPNETALTEFASLHGVPADRLYTDYEHGLTATEADAILITAASPVHYEICKAALEHGLHVLVEKPFVLSLVEGEELVALADSRNCRLMVSQNYRYLPTVTTLQRSIQSTGLGEITYVHAQFYCNHDGKPYEREMDRYMLMEMAVHHIDMMRYLLGEEIAEVRGRTWNAPGSGYRGDPNVSAVYTTRTRRVPIFYTGSLLAEGDPSPWEGLWKVQFQYGAVYLDDRGEGYGVYIENEQGECRMEPLVPLADEGVQGVLAEFAASIHEEREPAVSGRDNVRTLAALLAIG